ncbi:MAG: SRPBCC family protein [Chloroflexi bacterium]|nr:SRPBCC family protein [Chloroflexota bacterium]MCC6893396.1 SRPBCC family protein [Anaerolineae bacterium]
MTTLHFETTINTPPQAVFDLIADFAHYDRWLPGSGLYEATVELSENPVRLGTTYIDRGTSSTMHGQVTVCQPPEQISFHQQTRLKILFVIPAGLDVTIAYTLVPVNGGTHVKRAVTVAVSGALRLIQKELVKRISTESQRILEALKTHLENDNGD